MAELAIDDEGGGELEEGEIGIGALLPANEEATEAVEPGVGDFNNPNTLPVGHISESFRSVISLSFLHYAR